MRSNALSYFLGRYSCLNIFTIFNIFSNSNTDFCHYLALIAIPRLLLVDPHNAITMAFNQTLSISAFTVTLVMTLLPKIYHIYLTNQIHPIMATKDLTKKRYISLMIISLACIQRAFIQS